MKLTNDNIQQENCGDSPTQQQSSKVTSEEGKASTLRNGDTADCIQVGKNTISENEFVHFANFQLDSIQERFDKLKELRQ